MRWCWVNFQCRGVLLIWMKVGQGPSALAVGAGGGCLDIFSLVYHYFSVLSPSLWETARYRLKYYLKGPLGPKTTNKLNQQQSRCRCAMIKRIICFEWEQTVTVLYFLLLLKFWVFDFFRVCFHREWKVQKERRSRSRKICQRRVVG